MRISARPLPVSLRIALPLASSALIGIVLLSSCGSDSSGDGIGAGAQGGSSAGGAGTGGGSGAGQGGSGAAAGAPVGSAGSTSGGAFGAGLAGSSAGGAGNGDAGASEGGGAGDAAAGASGTGDAGAGEAGAGGSGSGGAAGDGGTGGGGAGGAGGSGDGIESCFAGLRPLQGISQIPTRENFGEQIRLRLALETADRISTSGTFPWAAVRLGLEIDGILICLDEAALASAYELSLHNCADVLTFESGGQRYEITDPDEPGGEAGMSLTVFSGASPVRGPIPLTTTVCVAGGSAITQCRSGGPC
jgi:hypothetical protein